MKFTSKSGYYIKLYAGSVKTKELYIIIQRNDLLKGAKYSKQLQNKIQATRYRSASHLESVLLRWIAW